MTLKPFALDKEISNLSLSELHCLKWDNSNCNTSKYKIGDLNFEIKKEGSSK